MTFYYMKWLLNKISPKPLLSHFQIHILMITLLIHQIHDTDMLAILEVFFSYAVTVRW